MSRFKSFLIGAAVSMSLVAAGAVAPATNQNRSGEAPPAAIDTDADGVNDPRDACPSTPATAKVLVTGCSALDMVTDPGAIVRPAVKDIAEAGPLDTRTFPELAEVARQLAESRSAFDAAGDQLGAGDVCTAAATVRDAVAGVERGRDRMSALVPELRRQVMQDWPRRPGAADEDADRYDSTWHELAAQHDVLVRAAARLQAPVQALNDACAAVAGPLNVRAKVAKTDDANRRIRFDTGQVVALPTNASADLVEGSMVTAKGVAFVDGTGVAMTLTDMILSQPSVFFPCIALQVVPLQKGFAPGPPQTLVLHPTAGYSQNGTLVLEAGMRLGVRDVPCPTGTTTPGSVWRYSMKIVATYALAGTMDPYTKVLGTDLHDGEVVAFPANVALGAPVAIATTVRRKLCVTYASGDQCGPLETMAGQTYQAVLLAKHALCSARGVGSVMLDDDPATDDFRAHRISVVETPPMIVTQGIYIFEAEGYAVNGGVSSRPQVSTIKAKQDYAVYDDDFYDPNDLFATEKTGVEGPAALRWPRIKGTHNGGPYWYSCGVKPIIRDAVEMCWSSGPHSYYKLPWKGFAKTTQGNNGELTHKGAGAFAFDFRMMMYDPIYATRGGTVVYVRENESKTSNPYLCASGMSPCEQGNAVKIKHQDGTYSWYKHMIPYSVVPEVDDVVTRGELLALVGQTGNATGPHLHYEVTETSGEYTQTVPIRFQAWLYLGGGPSPCHIPATGEILMSTQ